MSDSISDQMVDKGLVSEKETPEAKREAARAAQPSETLKALPPLFEAPARGVIVNSSSRAPLVARQCVECGATLRQDRGTRCAECAADPG